MIEERETEKIWVIQMQTITGLWVAKEVSTNEAFAEARVIELTRTKKRTYRVRPYISSAIVNDLIEALTAVWSYPGVAILFVPIENFGMGSIANKVVSALKKATTYVDRI